MQISMRSQEEIEQFLRQCNKVKNWGMSLGTCPLSAANKPGRCAFCSFPSGLLWVLGGKAIKDKFEAFYEAGMDRLPANRVDP